MRDSSMFVGLDYHQASIQVCVMDASGRVPHNRSVDNRVDQVIDQVPHGTTIHAAIEACNGAAELAERLIDDHDWSVSLAHAGYVHRLKQSPDKTDFSDAQLLADLTRVGYLPRVWLAPASIRQLRRLVRYRQTLVDQRRAMKLRIGGWCRSLRLTEASGAGRWTLRWRRWLADHPQWRASDRWLIDQALAELDHLTDRIDATETHLAEVVADDAVVRHLMSLAGVGLITACWLRAEIGRFDRFANGKQLARYCGLTPRNASSGQRQADGGLIHAANRQLRSVLIEAGWRLIRHAPRWSTLADQLRARGKAGPLIVAAVANRWVRQLHHQMTPAG